MKSVKGTLIRIAVLMVLLSPHRNFLVRTYSPVGLYSTDGTDTTVRDDELSRTLRGAQANRMDGP